MGEEISTMGKKAQKPRALEVEIIYGKRIKNGHTEYWIKWKGFPEKDSTWENVTNIEDKNAGKMIKAFEAKTKADEKAAKGASDKQKTPAKTAAEKKKTPAKAAAEKKKTPAKGVAEKKKAPAKVVAEKKKAPAKKTTPPKVVAEKKKAPAKKEAKAASKKRSVRDSDAAQAAKLIKEVLDHWESADASDESEDDSPPPAKRSKKAPKKLDDSPEPAPAKKKRTEKSPAKKAPPAKKQATEKKKTPAKKKEDIFQVESLSEVRKSESADGSREYFVKWDKGPATWEPEANIADDLIEEFEEEQMVQASAKAKFKNNMAVEVLNDTDGFEWSWTTAKIVSAGKKADSFNLEYALFEDGKGKPLKEKDVPKKRLRAVAKAAPKGWYPALGDKIEVAEDGCWWESQVTKEEKSKNKVKAMLRVSDEEKFFKIKDARPCAWDTSSTPAKAKRK